MKFGMVALWWCMEAAAISTFVYQQVHMCDTWVECWWAAWFLGFCVNWLRACDYVLCSTNDDWMHYWMGLSGIMPFGALLISLFPKPPKPDWQTAEVYQKTAADWWRLVAVVHAAHVALWCDSWCTWGWADWLKGRRPEWSRGWLRWGLFCVGAGWSRWGLFCVLAGPPAYLPNFLSYPPRLAWAALQAAREERLRRGPALPPLPDTTILDHAEKARKLCGWLSEARAALDAADLATAAKVGAIEDAHTGAVAAHKRTRDDTVGAAQKVLDGEVAAAKKVFDRKQAAAQQAFEDAERAADAELRAQTAACATNRDCGLRSWELGDVFQQAKEKIAKIDRLANEYAVLASRIDADGLGAAAPKGPAAPGAAELRHRRGAQRPPEHHCPIATEVMVDPVVAEDGHTYERDQIQQWFDRGETTSPLTRGAIGARLVPNQTLKSMIQEWRPHSADP